MKNQKYAAVFAERLLRVMACFRGVVQLDSCLSDNSMISINQCITVRLISEAMKKKRILIYGGNLKKMFSFLPNLEDCVSMDLLTGGCRW